MTRARDLADLGSGITSGDLADDSVTTAKITDANVTQAKLAGEAVNESKLQVSNAPTNGYMLTAQSGDTGGLTWAAAPTSSTTYGDVGTYVTAMRIVQNASITGGTTIAGSSLLKWDDGGGSTAFPLESGSFNTNNTSNAGLSGTWRQMGPLIKAGSTSYAIGALYVRIS
tara:strand:+ start:2498 stop:3007 length:510 start_codon:yes stop_codon:yes gene_type:complete